MISTFFITLGSSILGALVATLPTASELPTGVSDSLSFVASAINAFAYIFPVSQLFSAVGVVLAFELIWWSFFGFIWIWKRIPILGR